MKGWYNNKIVQVVFHLLGWTVFFALPGVLRPEFQHEGYRIVRPPFFTAENFVSHGVLVVLFYVNAYFLIPRFLTRKKIVRYVLLLSLIFSATILVSFVAKRIQEKRIFASISRTRPVWHPDFTPHFRHANRGPGIHTPLLFSVFAAVFVLAVSTAYRFVFDKLNSEKLEQLQQNEHLKTELTFLRSQISPHFIFNILNSAVSLARSGSDQLEPTLISLSNLLRYMLYNADDEKVPLTQEVEYLESYIDLQKIRFEEDIEIRFTKSGVFTGHVIEPMLLIPFVENAFKHGTGHINNPAIFIQLKESNGSLGFNVRNRFDSTPGQVRDKDSGIGLANVRKRLRLLYDDKFSLDVKVEGEWFEIDLNLVLK